MCHIIQINISTLLVVY